MSTDSSSDPDESEIPNLASLRTSKLVQKKIDERLAPLEHQSCIQGNNNVIEI